MAWLLLLPIQDLKPENLPEVVNNFQMIENLLNGNITGDNIEDLTITGAKVAANTLTYDKMGDGVGRTTGGQYTGDGTQNREINIGFMARFVHIIRHDTGEEFVAIGSGSSALACWRRSSAGVLTSGGTGNADWQGVSTNGFKLGAAVGGGASNAIQTYSYTAYR